MIGLKEKTVAARIEKLKKKIESARLAYLSEITKLNLEIADVQARCPHKPASKFINTWNGWDDHPDLKGHHEVSCKVCGKILETNIAPSRWEKESSEILSKYHLELGSI